MVNANNGFMYPVLVLYTFYVRFAPKNDHDDCRSRGLEHRLRQSVKDKSQSRRAEIIVSRRANIGSGHGDFVCQTFPFSQPQKISLIGSF